MGPRYPAKVYPSCPLHVNSLNVNDDECYNEWTDLDDKNTCLPMVCVSLKTLAPQMHALLDLHSGRLPLHNLVNCYEAVFEETFDTTGPALVPLEHLITCIHGLEVVTDSTLLLKYVQWSKGPLNSLCNSSTSEHSSSSVVDNQAKLMQQFAREVRDLIKSQPRSVIAFSKFVPAYHNHFGRQCCVYHYGYTKLIDLLETISNVVQILGGGSRKMLTLTHREQAKRFASDLIRILKAQPGKKMTLGQLPFLYEKTLEKSFHVENYGICFIGDIISDIWEGTVLITYPEKGAPIEDIQIEIPKKERTQEEKDRTKLLVKDIIRLLQSTQTFSLPFSKFIPSFHHYFNRQCKVSDFGFTKLIELFESLSPDIIELEDNKMGDEKIIKLSKDHRRKIIGGRLARIIRNHSSSIVPLKKLAELYEIYYLHPINYKLLGVDSIFQLVSQLDNMFHMLNINDLILVTTVDRRRIKQSSLAKTVKQLNCDIPCPPSNWLSLQESKGQYEDSKHTKKAKPRRIAANFDLQTPPQET